MDSIAAFRALALQLAWGADEALQDAPVDRLQPAAARQSPSPAPAAHPTPAAPAPPGPQGPGRAGTAGRATALAEHAASLNDLRDALAALDLGLRDTAMHAVFADGPPGGVAVLTDAPGTEDDSTGRPLSGPDGAYFDRMLASIGLTRAELLVLPLVFWRPPGGRPATPTEIDACLPIVRRALTLARPRALLAFAGPPATALLGRAATRRDAGTWRDLALPGLAEPVPTLVIPSPAACRTDVRRRREAWFALRLLTRRIGS
ncbi:MAG TPA: uracil-DNA glycosylase [Acidisphaera sp.]|nr:uracil-DNA glycosylase [Acidisphaera sp.]